MQGNASIKARKSPKICGRRILICRTVKGYQKMEYRMG
jgi:hypothetical protein